MKLKVTRFHNIEGRRKTDKGAIVEWSVIVDKDHVLLITEDGTKYKLNIRIGG